MSIYVEPENQKPVEKENQNCGYCGVRFKATMGDFLRHVNICEKDCVERHYGKAAKFGGWTG